MTTHRHAETLGEQEYRGLRPEESLVLEIARRFFIAYTEPEKQHWESAIDLGAAGFGADCGPLVSHSVLNVIRAVRCRRRSLFVFNDPRCLVCRQRVSRCERNLMRALRFAAEGDAEGARLEAAMLCEGTEVEQVVAALAALAQSLPERTEPLAAMPASPALH